MPLTRYQDPTTLGLMTRLSERTTDRSAAAAQEAMRGHAQREVAKTEQRGLTQRAALKERGRFESQRRDADLQKYLTEIQRDLQLEVQKNQHDFDRAIHSGNMGFAREAMTVQERLAQRDFDLREFKSRLLAEVSEKMLEGTADWRRILADQLAEMRKSKQAADEAAAADEAVVEGADQASEPAAPPGRFPIAGGALSLPQWAGGQPLPALVKNGFMSQAQFDLVQKARTGEQIPKEQIPKLRKALTRYKRVLEHLKRRAPRFRKQVERQGSEDKLALGLSKLMSLVPDWLGMANIAWPHETAEREKTLLKRAGGKEEILRGIDLTEAFVGRELAQLTEWELEGRWPGTSPGDQRAAGTVAEQMAMNMDTGQSPTQGFSERKADILSMMMEDLPESQSVKSLADLLGIPLALRLEGPTAEATTGPTVPGPTAAGPESVLPW